jgi:hypothetical protein
MTAPGGLPAQEGYENESGLCQPDPSFSMERKTRLELATFSLARRRSTN